MSLLHALPGILQQQGAAAAAPTPTYVALGTDSGGSSTTVTLGVPAGTASGDTMVAFVHAYGSGSAGAATASGWTEVASYTEASAYVAVLTRVAGGSEPSTYDFTIPAAVSRIGGMVTLSGVNATPVHVSATHGLAVSTASRAPAVTTTVANCLGVCYIGQPYTTPVTTPTNWTKRGGVYFDSGSILTRDMSTIGAYAEELTGQTAATSYGSITLAFVG